MSAPIEPELRPVRLSPRVLLVVWISFLIYSEVSAPVPGVNEPHYLCKARHFWQPDWCAADFFLTSTPAHVVFYATVGSLTQWLPFPAVAWIGRIVCLLVLACGWCRLVHAVSPGRSAPIFAAWTFLALTACGNFSGEWLVGGVEGKVLCYGLLFAAWAAWMEDRRWRAGLLAGLGVSFHPVVGVWGLLAAAGAALSERLARQIGWLPRRDPALSQPPVLGPMLVLALAALPGLIPVVQMLIVPVARETADAATYIQVYHRLKHHLDPMVFPVRAYLGTAALLVVWGTLIWRLPRADGRDRLHAVVAFATVFALAGIVIAWGPRPATTMPAYLLRGTLLKFYPFRLFDLILPITVAIGLTAATSRWRPKLQTVGYLVLLGLALFRANSLVRRDPLTQQTQRDWIAACTWVDQHLPRAALVFAPSNRDTFKWYARRAEYVCHKDCPQDAAGIVEWNRRLNFIAAWFRDHYDDEFYSRDELRQFHRDTGVTHIVTDRLGPMEPDPVFENDSFQVFDLSALDRRGWWPGQ